MESASASPELPLLEDLRPGQAEVVRVFDDKSVVVAKLPTGYGKTRTAVAAYARLRARGKVNRLLYIVPRSAQATQAAEDVPAELLKMAGVRTQAHEVALTSGIAVRAHRKGTAEVFVVTIQALSTSQAVAQDVAAMMEQGLWMIVVDEHHHYGVDKQWTRAIERLPRQAMLAMSATPDRPGEDPLFGTPDVSVSYIDACRRDRAVKEMELHSYEYRVDAVMVNGDVRQFTTRELFDEAGSDSPQDIERFIASRKMRWSPKYISPLILYPVERIVDYRTASIRAQMIVQAMSCSHAEMVCEQVRALIPESMRVDWVGTGPRGRSDADNRRIVQQFCPPKDPRTGRRNWTLDVLVNVGIAGEGLDSTDVCEVVFLTSPNINNSTLQTMGRGARVMRQVGSDNMVCVVNVDSASELAPFVGRKVMYVFDGAEDAGSLPDEGDGDDPPSEPDYRELPDEPSVTILDVSLTDIHTDPLYGPALDAAVATVSRLKPEYTEEQVRDLARDEAEAAIRRHIMERDQRFNASAVIGQLREQVDGAASKICGLVLKRAAASGVRVEKSLPGDIRRRINSRKKMMFGSIDAVDEEGLRQQYKWLKSLEVEVLTGKVPGWLQ
jgi:hypothetical protein